MIKGRGILTVCVCALALVWAPLLHARSIDFDCDVPPDHYSSVSAMVQGPNYVTSGTISVISERPGYNLPLAGVIITRPDDGKVFTGFQIVASKTTNKKFDVTMRSHAGDKNIIKTVDTIELNGSIPFHLALSSSGMLELSLGSANYSWDASTEFVSLKEARIMAMCSTGQFKFFTLAFSPEDAERPRGQ